MKNLIK